MQHNISSRCRVTATCTTSRQQTPSDAAAALQHLPLLLNTQQQHGCSTTSQTAAWKLPSRQQQGCSTTPQTAVQLHMHGNCHPHNKQAADTERRSSCAATPPPMKTQQQQGCTTASQTAAWSLPPAPQAGSRHRAMQPLSEPAEHLTQEPQPKPGPLMSMAMKMNTAMTTGQQQLGKPVAGNQPAGWRHGISLEGFGIGVEDVG
jgi:hypothetical protein